MGDGGNKRSIDQMIEHMTADVQNSDGQYIQLGFTPPSTPGTQQHPPWPLHHHHYLPQHCPESPVFYPAEVPYEVDLAGKRNELLRQQQQQRFYYAAAPPPQQQLGHPRELVLEVGNVVNVGALVGGQQYRLVTEGEAVHPHPLGGFVPYHREPSLENVAPEAPDDYGPFGGRPYPPQQQQRYQQVQAGSRGQLIENLVGNWVPNRSGTYSPFGCQDAGLRPAPPLPATSQRTTQTAPEHGGEGPGRGVRKARIVAEVKPMRPSYSDVLAKSAPPQQNGSPASKQNAGLNGSAKGGGDTATLPGKAKPGGASKGGGKKNKNGALKRQHSSGSDEHGGGKAPAQQTRKSTGGGGGDPKHRGSLSSSFHALPPRKWVSLDDLDSDKQAAAVLLEEQDVFVEGGGGRPHKPVAGDGNAPGKKSSRSKSVQQEDKWDGGASPLNNKTLNFSGASAANASASSSPSSSSPLCPNGGGKLNGNGGASSGGGGGGGGGKRPAIHINNNLGSSLWGQARGGGVSKNVKAASEEKKAPPVSKESKSRSCGGGSRSGCGGGSSSGAQNGVAAEKPSQGKRSQRGKKRAANSPIAMVCQPVKQQAWRWAQMGMSLLVWFTLLLYDVLGMSSKLLAHMCLVVYARVRLWTEKACRKLSAALRGVSLWPSGWWNRGKKKRNAAADDGGGDKVRNGIPAGLESNISLPSTGEEAMKRLLACKGKDPYSILGVTPTSTDDDIKKYYKRQAFLVHPDKNNQPGAEEAFKILVHAFELIGEPERRKAYDRRVAETQQVEQAWSELNDLLSQLHQKMEYAANTIRCTNCGKRHRRISVDRPCYAARMCSQCKIHHSAREGDIWAESSVLGFLWHYYACMDGAIYDITEWAACQADNLRHLRANTHAVQYRIVLGRHQAPPRPRGQESASDPDLESFLNNLYSQQGGGGGAGGGNGGDVAGNQARSRRKGKRKK